MPGTIDIEARVAIARLEEQVEALGGKLDEAIRELRINTTETRKLNQLADRSLGAVWAGRAAFVLLGTGSGYGFWQLAKLLLASRI